MNRYIILILAFCFSALSANNKSDNYLINPIETPHGILLTNSFESALYLLNNGKLETLISAPGCGRYIQVSPKGNIIGFKLIDPKTKLQAPAIYDLEKRTLTKLHDFVKNSGQVSFSSNNKIAFTIENELFIKIGNETTKFDLGFYTNRATISPNGKLVVFSNEQSELSILDLESMSIQKITDGEIEYYNASWSPNNLMLAFQSVDAKINLYDFNSQEMTLIANGENPKWKSDSKSIVFFNKEIDFENVKLINSDIFEYNIEKRKLSKVTDSKNSFEMNPNYSTNGKIIYQNYNNNEIIQINSKSNSETLFKLENNLESDIFYSNNKIENPDVIKGLEQWQHIHQVFSSRDSGPWTNDPVNGRHQGYLCCGAASAMEIIASYNILPPDPIYTHGYISQFGKYLSDIYTYNNYTYNNFTIAVNSPGFTSGAHGYMWNNGSPYSNAENFLKKHGIDATLSDNITWTKVKAELDMEFPYMLCSTSLTDGHIVVGIGQYGDGHTLYCNDPYGDKNAGNYGGIFNGKNAIYDWGDANTGHMTITPVVWGITARYTRTLKIVSTYPADNETDVSTSVNPQINFYGEINPNTVENKIQLFYEDESGFPLLVNYDLSKCAEGTVTILPMQKLKENSTYSIIIYNGIEGANGILSNQNTKITFTTGESFNVVGNVLDDFEAINDWQLLTNGTDVNATSITISNENTFSGNNSAKLDYKFVASSGGYCRILYSPELELDLHNEKSVGLWVFGDNSKSTLQYWFTNQNSTLLMGFQEIINWIGWKFRALDLGTIENASTLKFNSIAIRQTTTGKNSGTLFFDNLTLFNTPLQIVNHLPENKGSNVSVNSEIVIEFNKPVDNLSVENAFQIVPQISGKFVWNSDKTIVTFTPDSVLEANTNYFVAVDTLATALSGVKLNSKFTFTFKTERKSLSLISVYPENGSHDISVKPDIILSFDGAISSLTLPGNVFFQNAYGNNVQISVDQSGYASGKVKFTPANPLDESSVYKILLSEKVGDTKGLTLNQNFEFTFTTEANKYVSGIIYDTFESNSGWSNPTQTENSVGLDNLLTQFIISNSKAKNGKYSGKLAYKFLGIEAVCRTTNNGFPKISADNDFGLWVYGDNSQNILEYWFVNDNSFIEKIVVDTINWTGWKLKNVNPSDFTNSDSLKFNSVVIKQNKLGNSSGAIYLDDLQTDIVLILPVNDGKDNLPSKYVLNQNYPNPFNSSTTIKYSIPQNTEYNSVLPISLKIYDILGREVATLVSKQQKPGNYEVKFNASHLSSGVYFYVLKSGDFNQSKKMILLK